MLGIIGLTAILGCVAILGAVVAAAGIVVGATMSSLSRQQAEDLANEAQKNQDKAEEKAENRMESQKDAAFKMQEKKNAAAVMAMGSAILAEKISAGKTKYDTVSALEKSHDVQSKHNYSYGTPVAPVDGSQQSQGQTNS